MSVRNTFSFTWERQTESVDMYGQDVLVASHSIVETSIGLDQNVVDVLQDSGLTWCLVRRPGLSWGVTHCTICDSALDKLPSSGIDA